MLTAIICIPQPAGTFTIFWVGAPVRDRTVDSLPYRCNRGHGTFSVTTMS